MPAVCAAACLACRLVVPASIPLLADLLRGYEVSRRPDKLVAKKEYYQMQEPIRLEAEKLSVYGNFWSAAIKKTSYRKRVIIGFLTQWGAEFDGLLIINNHAVILYQGLGETGSMPLLLSAVWLTTAGVNYNPLGAWLHDKVNSRRGMDINAFVGIIVTTSTLAAMTVEYAGTMHRGGNAVGILMMYLYLAFQGHAATPISNAMPANSFLIKPHHVLQHDYVSLRV